MNNLLRSSILCLTLGFIGCSTVNQNQVAIAKDKPIVVVSHDVLCDLTKTIAADTIELNCLQDSGQNIHTYSPTPADKKAIESAQLILYGGYQLEPTITKLIQASNNPAPKIPIYERAVSQPIMVKEHHHEGEDINDHHTAEETNEEEELQADSHVWHNVNNVMTIVELLQSLLVQMNPNEAVLYLQNAQALSKQLGQLNVWIGEQIATIPQGKNILVTAHDSLNYYAQTYDFADYKTLQGLGEDAGSTAARLGTLATKIQEIGVATIFAEAGESDRLIKTIAREANVQVGETPLLTESLGQPGTPTDNYMGMMTTNTCAIVEGLGGECTPFQ